ncbi:MAG: type III pantothenate kinase [Armatimonadota bacterium]|jgi:type III pantothenate kinase
MLLAIDVGNTSVHLGLFDRGELVRQWRLPSDRARRARSLRLRTDEANRVTGALMCAVAPSLAAHVGELLRTRLGVEPVVVERPAQTGIRSRYARPETVGIDRLVTCRAAYELCRDAVVVVDVGTAITVDAVSADGMHLGGAIAPGIDLSAAALAEHAELLRPFKLARPKKAIGATTLEGLRSGFVIGFAGLVDHIVRAMNEEMHIAGLCIATGGGARLIAPWSEEIEHVEGALTLQGLRMIHEEIPAKRRRGRG